MGASGGKSPPWFLRFAILLRLKLQGTPSLAHPFAGKKVHWTFFSIRLTLKAPNHSNLQSIKVGGFERAFWDETA